ncbi:MAG: protein tyrosine/serine phosphatase [Proteobacteria bacterium]|jgi:protein-tyrosine phosphatase|nr:protein tyrosine/serine phosphatase [Pseudomonadota bacterium]
MPNPPQRVWPLQGATNFRDLGGYPGQDGRPVRWRRLFRSDHLGGLTEADKALLTRLGLARAFDFRGQAERAAVTYELPGVTQHSLAIEPTVVQRLQDLVSSGQALTPERAAELMTELYRALVNDQSHRFAELFEHLLQAEGPVVFHCTAGKDRTGFAAALILLALGVPRDLVLEDYLITNRVFQHPPAAQGGLPAEVLAVLWRVQPGFLEAALHAVDTDHGGVERYLSKRLGMGPAARQQLAQRYLAPDPA